jgi:CHAD domain-containing protein
MGGVARARTVDGLHAQLPLELAAARTVRVRTDELFDHLRLAGGDPDADTVHDIRVATRRLRAVLEVYAPCFAKRELRPVLRDVKALADAFGARRDPDVQLLALDGFAAAVKEADRPGVEAFAARVRAERAAGDDAVAAGLARAAETDLRGRLLALAEAA